MSLYLFHTCFVDIDGALFVYIENSGKLSDAILMKYISDMYSRVWDEMLLHGKKYLDCVIVGEPSNCSFTSFEKFFSHSDITTAYITDLWSKKRITDYRTTFQLPPVDFKIYEVPQYEETIYYFDADDEDIPLYKKVAVGGTFDRLHNGHRKLLLLSAGCCTETLTIGVMSDELLRGKNLADIIYPVQERKHQVSTFMQAIKPQLRYQIVTLNEPFGPTIVDPRYQAIVVSSETLAGAIKINAIRREKQFPSLDILVIRRRDVSTLSSSFLREYDKR
jgi:pantetheine-phosphate adenylyltransferase